jgi:two-component system, LytTR family, response regulator
MYDFLFIKKNGEYLKLPFSEIIYLEAVNKYVRVITKTKCYLISITMNSIEKMLPHSIFRRIHRSHIISLHYVTKFDNSMVHLENRTLPIGKHYKEGLLLDIIVLCSDGKSSNKLSNGDINKLLTDINPQ